VTIFVIIPVYGNWPDTAACLQSLAAQTTQDFQIVIADDGSPEPPPADIRTFPRVRYFRFENAGFGTNCNRAAQEAIALGATHLLFLNNDTHCSPAFMQRWIERTGTMPDAILSPLIYWAGDPRRVWTSGGSLSVLTPFVRARTAFEQVTLVDVVTGCAILVPSAVWSSLGGFDPRYTMYFEDFDFTLRAKARGMRTYIVPDKELHVLHEVSGSFRSAGAWSKYYRMLTSSLIFIRSHYKGIRKPVCFALAFVHLAVTALLSLPELPRPKPLWNSLTRGFSG